MRIAIGSLQCEGNSLTPIHTRFEDFDYAVGEAMYDEVQVVDYFKEHKCGVVPTIYAHALPGGAVVKKDFLRLVNELVDEIPTEGIDGVWLYLHGAMYVEGIGSGDTYLLQKIRDKVGYNIPISVAMDFHADNTDEIIKNVNCVTAFRTAPHCDHKDTQIRAATKLHNKEIKTMAYYNMQETEKRIRQVREILRAKGLDAALIYFDELNIANGWYLTGWCGQFEKGSVLIPVEGEPILLGGPESEPFAKMNSAITKVRCFPVFMVPDEEYPTGNVGMFGRYTNALS